MANGLSSLVRGRNNLSGACAAYAVYVLSGIIGGVATVGIIWVVATPLREGIPRAGRIGFVAAAVAVLFFRDLRREHSNRSVRMVPASWFGRFGPVRAYTQYGAILGGSVWSHVPFGLANVVFWLAPLLAPLTTVMVAGGLFGLARTSAAIPLMFLARDTVDLPNRSVRFARPYRATALAGLAAVAALGVGLASQGKL